jgi:hypothetical protein
MGNFNKTIGKRRADTPSVEYSMQQLGLLPTATLTVNGGWPWRRSREWLIAMRTCTVCWLRPRTAMLGNPLVKIAADAAEDMLRFAGEFGLTPVARTRLASAGYGPSTPSKFDGLLR